MEAYSVHPSERDHPIDPSRLATIVEDHHADRPWTWTGIRWAIWWMVLLFAAIFAIGGLAIGDDGAADLLALCVLTSLYSLGPWWVWRADRRWLAALATVRFSPWSRTPEPAILPRRTTAARLWNLWFVFVIGLHLVCYHQLAHQPRLAARNAFLILLTAGWLLFLLSLACCWAWYRDRTRLIQVADTATLMDFGFALDINSNARSRLSALPWFAPERHLILRYFLDGRVGPWNIWVFDWLDPQHPVVSGRGWQTVIFVTVNSRLPNFDLMPNHRPWLTKGMAWHVLISLLHGPAGWALLLVGLIARGLGARRKARADGRITLQECPELTQRYELLGDEPVAVRACFRDGVADRLLGRDELTPGNWLLQGRGRSLAMVRVGRSCAPAQLPQYIAQALEIAAGLETNATRSDTSRWPDDDLNSVASSPRPWESAD